MSKSTLKNGFFSKRLKMKQNTLKIEAHFYMYFDFRLGWTLFKVRKLVSRSARSQSWLCPFDVALKLRLVELNCNFECKNPYSSAISSTEIVTFCWNFECDWLTEMSKIFSDNKLSDNNLSIELVKNRSFLNQSQSRKL